MDQPSPNASNLRELPPREPEYATKSGLRVGPAVLELAERLSFGRDDAGTPRAGRSNVVTVAMTREIESKAEALALAAALEVFAADLP